MKVIYWTWPKFDAPVKCVVELAISRAGSIAPHSRIIADMLIVNKEETDAC